ncbi:MAG: hypothetical protein JFR41_06200 [Muribaculaceae bacterium]|nr:hypothetical protein [Muribaculaceae bacterium]
MANAIIYEISAKDSLSAALQKIKANAESAEEAMARLNKASNEALSQVPVGQIQQLANFMGELGEGVNKISSTFMPFMEWASGITTVAANIVAMNGALKILNINVKVFGMTLKMALMGTGVFAAIVALNMAMEALCGSMQKTESETDKLISQKQRLAREAEALKSRHEEESRTMQSASAGISVHIAMLEAFSGTKEQEKKLVNELNNAYGDTMGYFSSVSDWYKALVANSETYCKQMLLEARTRKLAERMADRDIQIADIRQGIKNGEYGGVSRNGKVDPRRNKATAQIINLNQANKRDKFMLESTSNELAGLKFSVVGSETRPNLDKGKNGNGDAATEQTRLQEITTLVAKLKEEYLTASAARRAAIKQEISLLGTEAQKIEELYKEVDRPNQLVTMGDIDKEISYQQSLLPDATGAEAEGINKEIRALQQLRTEKELAWHTPVKIDDITTYKQLEDELSYYTMLLQNGTAEERLFAQQHINDLNKVKDKWDETLEALEKPGDIKTLNTYGEIDSALAYYRTQQQKATGDEIADIEKTIRALEKKRDALGRGVEVMDMQAEADELNGLEGKDLKMKIGDLGLDALKEKLRMLKAMLADTENPLPDNVREQVEGLVESYEGYVDAGKKMVPVSGQIGDGLSAAGQMMGNISGLVGDSAGAWLDYGANILQTASQAIPAIMAMTCANAANSAAQTPVVGWIMAGAAIASMIAAFAAIPAFANGGIVYGPTLGLFGEYAGASGNPEVVAPLNRLKELIGPARDGGARYEQVDVRIDGRNLVAVLAKNGRYRDRM